VITLVSTIIGFLASLLPALVKMFEKKQDYKHEIELRRIEIEAAKEGIALHTRLEQIKAVIEQNRSIYAHDQSIDGNNTINLLRASVRPVLTYSFFILFVFIKLVALASGVIEGLAIDALLGLIWDEYTASIFGSIIAFWFGSRLWEKTDMLSTNRTSSISTTSQQKDK
jgi:hypothetical protein